MYSGEEGIHWDKSSSSHTWSQCIFMVLITDLRAQNYPIHNEQAVTTISKGHSQTKKNMNGFLFCQGLLDLYWQRKIQLLSKFSNARKYTTENIFSMQLCVCYPLKFSSLSVWECPLSVIMIYLQDCFSGSWMCEQQRQQLRGISQLPCNVQWDTHALHGFLHSLCRYIRAIHEF